jgi:hypothetical protein
MPPRAGRSPVRRFAPSLQNSPGFLPFLFLAKALDRLTFSYLRKSFYFLHSRYHVWTSSPTHLARIGSPSRWKSFQVFRGLSVYRSSCYQDRRVPRLRRLSAHETGSPYGS